MHDIEEFFERATQIYFEKLKEEKAEENEEKSA